MSELSVAPLLISVCKCCHCFEVGGVNTMRVKERKNSRPLQHPYPRAFCTVSSISGARHQINDRDLRSHRKMEDCEERNIFLKRLQALSHENQNGV